MNRMVARLVVASALGVLGLIAAGLSAQSPGYGTAFLILFAMAALIGVSAGRVLTGDLYWFSPHVAFLGGFFLIYVAATAAMIHYAVPSHVFQRPLTPDEYAQALTLCLVSLVCYLLGWRLGPKRQTMSRGLEWFLTDTPAVRATFDYACIGMMVAGFIAWFYIFSFAGGVSGQLENIKGRNQASAEAGGWVMHIAFFTYAGVLLYFSRHGFNLISIGSIGLFLFILLVFGSRSYAATLVMGVLAIYTFRFRGKLPLVVWIAAIAGMFTLMTFWVLLRQTRGRFDRAAEAYTETMSTTEGFVMQSLGNMMFIAHYAEWMDAIGTRVEPQYGRTMLGFLRIIPNMIWDKGDLVVSGSKLYLQTFFPQKIGVVSLSSPLFIEYYVNFKWPGVIIFSALNGIVARWLDSRLLRHPHRRVQVAHIVICGLLFGITVKLLKQGVSIGVMVYYYVFLPIVIVYLPNLPLLLNPPRDDEAQELGDVPRSLGHFQG